MERNMLRSELFHLRTRTAGILVARTGQYWLTRPGDIEDYLIDRGERVVVPAGQWLVQALTSGTLEWTTAVRAPVRMTYEADRLSSVSGL